MNLISIVFDTLRFDHVGVNGNTWIKTPVLDAFAGESVQFTNYYPEALPTIPMRQGLFTGVKVLPKFNTWKGSYHHLIPGWCPIDHDIPTTAEILDDNSYLNAMISDVPHLFRPAMNYSRGFHHWEFIRGHEVDLNRSHVNCDPDLSHYLPESGNEMGNAMDVLKMYARRVSLPIHEDECFAPKVFKTAVRWLEENYKAEQFYLYIDSFDPHEPFDPPQQYRELYSPGYEGREIVWPPYSLDAAGYLKPEELEHMHALYAGKVTMLDFWLGHFLQTVEHLGLMDNTIISIMSDHGFLFGEHNSTGKPPDKGLFPEVMKLVHFVKVPGQEPAVIDALTYTHDHLPTMLHLLGIDIPDHINGQNFWDLVEGKRTSLVEQVSSGFKNRLFAFDGVYWLTCNRDRSDIKLFDVKKDPQCANNIAEGNEDVVERLFAGIVKDSGGEIASLPPIPRYTACIK